MSSNPGFRARQIACDGDRVSGPISPSNSCADVASQSRTAFTKADTFSDLKDRMDVARWRRSSIRPIPLTESFESEFRRVLGVGEIGRDINAPVREAVAYRVEPVADAGLARVNLLTTADETDDDGPGFVPIEIRDQELRLGSIEVRDASSAAS